MIDWPAIHREALDILVRYLQIDTSNPPGNEKPAALFLGSLCEAEGIDVEYIETAPNREVMVARLRGDGSKRPIMLCNHTDVVPVEAPYWTVPAFEGVIKDGRIYGRGTVDMKGCGVMQLIAALLLKRESVALKRDVVFCAVPDEEAGSDWGMLWLCEHRPDEGDGEVIAEAKRGGMEAYLHRHYPASDIPQRARERCRIHERTAGGVHEHRVRLHQRELALADQVLRRGRDRAVQRERVHLRQQCVQVDAARFRRTADAIREPHVHPERRRDLGDAAAERAVADDPERAARELANRVIEHRELIRALPRAGLQRAIVLAHLVREREQHGPHVLHDGGRAVVADVAHGDAALAGGIEVDVVGAGRGERDELQLRVALDALARDPGLVDQHDLAARNAFVHCGVRRVVVQLEAGEHVEERSRVEIAAERDGGVVEERGLHRGGVSRIRIGGGGDGSAGRGRERSRAHGGRDRDPAGRVGSAAPDRTGCATRRAT